MIYTESKNTEARLKANEQQLKLIFNSTNDIIFFISVEDRQYKFSFVNRAFLTTTGLKDEEVVGKYVTEVIPRPSLSLVLKKYNEAIQKSQPIEWEETSDYPAGQKTGIVIINPVFNERGECTMLVGVVHDITERKKAEQKLIETEAKFKNIVEQSLMGVYIIENAKFVYVSPRFAEIFGYKQKDLLNLPVDQVIYTDDWPMVAEYIRIRLEGGQDNIHYHARGLKRNGEMIWIEVFCSGKLKEKSSALMGTLLDITKRKSAEEERERALYLLNERIKELTTLYRCNQIFQAEKKSIGEVLQEIVSILPSAWQYPGITAARIAVGDEEFKTSNFASGSHKQYAQFVAPNGKNSVVEIVYLEPRPMASEDAFLTEERNLINMLAEMLGMYLARKHEAEVKKIMEQEILDQKVQEQKKIIRAVLKAEERERNKIGQELHDNVNQILASIKLFLSMAKEDAATSNNELLNRSEKLIDNVIQEIRELSESQVTPLKKDDLQELIQSLVDKLEYSTSIKIKFIYEVKDSVIDDDLKLNIYRIVQEQINNILRHADASHIHIFVSTEGGFLHVSVDDNGKGFDPDKKRKGIGISNMINRAESFNGELKIETSPGAGCKLAIKIPVDSV